MAKKVMQDALGGVHGVISRTRHGATQHAHRVGVWYDSSRFRLQSIRDDEREVGARGGVVALEGRGHAFGQISVDELRNVVLLFEEYTVRVSGDVHVE
eukprot:3048682-Pleurochrysis_carterae.AAC.1